MNPKTISKIAFAIILLGSIIAKADDRNLGPTETWTVDGKVYVDKGAAIRHIIASGKRTDIQHTRCEILTNKMTFKACPKSKQGSFENEQFSGLNK